MKREMEPLRREIYEELQKARGVGPRIAFECSGVVYSFLQKLVASYEDEEEKPEVDEDGIVYIDRPEGLNPFWKYVYWSPAGKRASFTCIWTSNMKPRPPSVGTPPYSNYRKAHMGEETELHSSETIVCAIREQIPDMDKLPVEECVRRIRDG